VFDCESDATEPRGSLRSVARLQWDKAAREQRVRERGTEPFRDERPPPARRARGISNDQARELARLQQMLGEPYSGRGMTAAEASRAINAARARLGR
jgi:hypothetical protein